MSQRIEQAKRAYEHAVFNADLSDLDVAGRELDALEADVALCRGRLLHAAFLAGASKPADPAELLLFERARDLYRALGDDRGEGEALFWIGCFHQVVDHDQAAAEAPLRQAERLSRDTGDKLTLSHVLRHQGIAMHMAGELEVAKDLLERSTALRRELDFSAGVAANLVGLAYVAAAQGSLSDALTILAEAEALARASGAQAIRAQIEEARAALPAPD